MRALIVVTGACLTLAACNNDGAVENAATVNASLASEAIFANDTTAIDAATGDAANMAADVDYTISNSDGGGAVSADGSVDRRTVTRRRAAEDEPAPADASEPISTDSPVETNEI
jgi:hypothetical protein